MANLINLVIVALALYEVVLFLKIKRQCTTQESQLYDLYFNITKSLNDVPDHITGQTTFDRASALLAYMERKIAIGARDLSTLRRNIGLQMEKNAVNNTFPLEKSFSIASTLVHVFPLLGILGTLIALYGLTGSEGELSGSGIESAFLAAIITTILGMSCAAIFMFWEARVATRVTRLVANTEKANQLFAKAVA